MAGHRQKDDDLWYWYNIFCEARESHLPETAFCKMHNISRTKFSSKKWKMFNCKYTNPQSYAERALLYEDYITGNLTLRQFVIKHKIQESIIADFRGHLGQLEAIERIKKEKSIEREIVAPSEIATTEEAPEPISFIQLNMPTSSNIVAEQGMPIMQLSQEPKNDIELKITQGVKVIISPQIDSLKIIKIIELLKDL